MRRLLLCLAVGLLFISGSSSTESPRAATFRDVSDDGAALPNAGDMERLAKKDPIAFLETCIRRYDREVHGYTAVLRKQERIKGRLQRSELVDVAFREEPFSVLMRWKRGARQAKAVLYVKGQNNDQLLASLNGILAIAGIVRRDANGADAKAASRYSLTEFGIKIGMQRTLASWRAASKDGSLHVEYLGVKRIKEAGNRPCWVLKRSRYKKPENDGITGLTMYIDKESWLQVGTVLKGEKGRLIGEYFFRVIKINPDFPAGAFSREALKR